MSLKAQHGRKEPVNKFSVGQYLGREVLGQALTVQYCTAAKAEGYTYTEYFKIIVRKPKYRLHM